MYGCTYFPTNYHIPVYVHMYARTHTHTHTHTSSLPFSLLGEGKVKVGGVTLADSVDLSGTLYSKHLSRPARGDFGCSFGLLWFPCSELGHILIFILNDRGIPTT